MAPRDPFRLNRIMININEANAEKSRALRQASQDKFHKDREAAGKPPVAPPEEETKPPEVTEPPTEEVTPQTGSMDISKLAPQKTF